MVSLQLRRVAVIVVGCIALTCLSCGKTGPKLHPVRGKVLYLDKAPEGATVVFQLVGVSGPDLLTPSGTVQSDGTFTLRTHPHGEGAPAGDYNVLISWLPPDARSLGENVANKLPARYSNPSAPVFTAKIKEGANELVPFKLTK